MYSENIFPKCTESNYNISFFKNNLTNKNE